MADGANRRVLDRVFSISLILKGINGALEILGSIALVSVSPDTVRHMLRWVSSHWIEAVDGRTSTVGHWVAHLADRLNTDATIFGALYLVLHGVVKIILVIALLRERLWAYPAAIVTLTLFVLYQCWELFAHFSWWMLLLTVFDLLIIWMTAREWQLHAHRVHASRSGVHGKL